MLAQLARGLVEIPPELADLPRVLLHRLLLPPVRHRPQQRNQRRRTCRDDALFEPDAELDERRVLLERRAEEHFAWQEHDDEVGAGVDVRGVALGRQLREVHAHLARVIGEQHLPRRFVRRLERLEVRVERHLGVDDDVLAAGERDDDVGPKPAIRRRPRSSAAPRSRSDRACRRARRRASTAARPSGRGRRAA